MDIKLKSLLSEDLGDKLYLQNDTLWIAYGPGSGNTRQIRDLKTYITNKPGDDHFDYLATLIEKWTTTAKPISKKGNTALYAIPQYTGYNRDLDIWGGSEKPTRNIYLLISKMGSGHVVINLFKTKSEAIGFWSK